MNKIDQSIIPVVFAVNANYEPYVYIAITSLIEHCSSKKEYHIYVLHTH